MGWADARADGGRVLVYSDSGKQQVVETVRVGQSFRVKVIKISALRRFMIEVSRKAVMLRMTNNSVNLLLDQEQEIQRQRAIDFFSSWQRAAYPNVTQVARTACLRRVKRPRSKRPSSNLAPSEV